MKDLSSQNLENNTQELFLEVAGYVIKLTFGPKKKVYFKRYLIREIIKLWGKTGFLKKKSSTFDFEIRFASTEKKVEILQKKSHLRSQFEESFILTLRKNFDKRIVYTYYFLSLSTLVTLLQEILLFLLVERGFILHASSCLDKDGNLNIFTGKGGSGKTTVSNLISDNKNYFKFNDDLLLIKKDKDNWGYYSVPILEGEDFPVKREAAKSKGCYFIQKSNNASKKRIISKARVLNLILNFIRERMERLDNKTMGNIIDFINEHDFYDLKTSLNAEELRKVINEN